MTAQRHTGRYAEAAFREDGTLAKGVAVTVTVTGSSANADLFTDRDRTGTAANPVTTDPQSGMLAFWAEPGLYDLIGPGVTLLAVPVGVDAADVAPLDVNALVPVANLPTGTTSSTVAAGNDARITGAEQVANKGIAGGYVPLDSSGQVPAGFLPGGGSAVLAVAGRTGYVTLGESDISGLSSDLAATEKAANRGAASGYAPLDASSLVPVANLPTAAVAATVRVQSVSAPGGDSTLLLDGVLPPAVATANVTPSADDQAEGPLIKYLMAAVSSVDAGVISPFGVLQPRWSPYFYARLRTDPSSLTSMRLAVGLVSADVAANAGPASTGSYSTAAGAWFRYDTSTDGTALWRTVTGSGTTATVTTTATAIAADTSYELVIQAGTSAVSFWIGGVLVATHTTNLPGASTALAYTARLRTLTASARALRLGRLAWSQR
jgi:hypothetical protein